MRKGRAKVEAMVNGPEKDMLKGLDHSELWYEEVRRRLSECEDGGLAKHDLRFLDIWDS